MDSMLLGDKNRFAIEYRLAEPHTYISAILLVNGNVIGDITDALMPGIMCEKLLAMCDVPQRFQDFTYDTMDDAPTDGPLLDDVSQFFLGETFDWSNLAYFRLLDVDSVYFSWCQKYRPGSEFAKQQTASHFESVNRKEYQDTVMAFVDSLVSNRLLPNRTSSLDAMLLFLSDAKRRPDSSGRDATSREGHLLSDS